MNKSKIIRTLIIASFLTLFSFQDTFASNTDTGSTTTNACGSNAAWCYNIHKDSGGWEWVLFELDDEYDGDDFNLIYTSNRPGERNFITSPTHTVNNCSGYNQVWVLVNFAHKSGENTGGEFGISIDVSYAMSHSGDDDMRNFGVATLDSKNGKLLDKNGGDEIGHIIKTGGDHAWHQNDYLNHRHAGDPRWTNSVFAYCTNGERETRTNSKSHVTIDGSQLKMEKYHHADQTKTKEVTKKAGQNLSVQFNHHLRMHLNTGDWNDEDRNAVVQWGIIPSTSSSNTSFPVPSFSPSNTGVGNGAFSTNRDIDEDTAHVFNFFKPSYHPTTQESCATSPYYRKCDGNMLKFGQNKTGEYRYRYNVGWDDQTFSTTLPYVNTNTVWQICEKIKYKPQKIKASGDEASNSGVGSTNSCAKITITPVHAKVVPTSAVTTNGADPSDFGSSKTASATINAGETATIKFKHKDTYQNVDGLPKNQIGNFTYTISRPASTKSTTGNGPSSIGYPTSNFASGTASGVNLDKTFDTDTFTFSVPQDSINVDTTYTICQKNKVDHDYHTNNSTSSGSAESQACASVTVKPVEKVSYCYGTGEKINGLGNISAHNNDANGYNFSTDLKFSNLAGGTYGYSSVKNNTNSQKAKTSETASDTKTIYGKPGDEIKFTHALCFGARRVTNIDSGNNSGVNSTVKNQTNSIQLAGSPTNSFLFENKANQLATTVTFKGSQNPTPSELSSKTDYLSNYVARVYAPTGTTGAYNCTIKDEAGGTKNQSDNKTFMIPGRSNTSGCSSASKIGLTSVVGKTFSEQMTYNPLTLAYNNSNTSGSVSGNTDASKLTTKAAVDVPYNFTMGASVKQMALGVSGDTKIAFAGETISSSFQINVNARKNTATSGSTPYATITPPKTLVQTVSFIIPASKLNEVASMSAGNTTGTPVSSSTITPSNPSDPNVCKWFTTRLRLSDSDCTITNKVGSTPGAEGSLNKDGNLNGKEETDFKATSSVPDIDVGGNTEAMLICVAAGVFPADSHKNPTAADAGTLSQSNAMESGVGSASYRYNNTGFDWMVSDPSCQTIAKKPNFQVWGAAYSKGPIQTSLSKKDIEASSNESSFKPNAVFGSWSEFETISGNTVTGFGSGASLGFGTQRRFAVGNKNTTVQNPYAGYNLRKDTNATGKTYCELVRLTLGNSSCTHTSNSVENSGVELQTDISDKFRAIYAGSNLPSTQSGETINFADDASNVKITDKGVKIIKKNNAKITSNINVNDVNGDHETQVIYVSNTLKIESDITTNDSGYDASYYVNSGSGFVPQLIFIVDGNVEIAENVTNIDAWIITNGKVNTCTTFKRASGEDSETTGADRCASKLRFNYPVIAKGGFELNRTAGALRGNGWQEDSSKHANTNLDNDGSVAPAEIFNLRSDALLWAYHQSRSNTQANTVYTAELPPRY